jgi:flagellar hook-length control protein FliK
MMIMLDLISEATFEQTSHGEVKNKDTNSGKGEFEQILSAELKNKGTGNKDDKASSDSSKERKKKQPHCENESFLPMEQTSNIVSRDLKSIKNITFFDGKPKIHHEFGTKNIKNITFLNGKPKIHHEFGTKITANDKTQIIENSSLKTSNIRTIGYDEILEKLINHDKHAKFTKINKETSGKNSSNIKTILGAKSNVDRLGFYKAPANKLDNLKDAKEVFTFAERGNDIQQKNNRFNPHDLANKNKRDENVLKQNILIKENKVNDSATNFSSELNRVNQNSLTQIRSIQVQPLFNQTWNLTHQIVQKISFYVAEGKTFMEMELKPKFLGKVRVNLSYHEGVVTASLTAEKGQTGQLLGSYMQQIKNDLQEQGIRVDYLGVNVGEQDDAPNQNNQSSSNQRDNPTWQSKDMTTDVNVSGLNEDSIQNQYFNTGVVNYLA